MLQQTRVAAVLDHYARFMQRFPTVQALAAARESSVLAAWSGLGYYHRARRMHQAAKIVARGARRSVSAIGGRVAGPAGYRPLHRSRGCQHCLRRSRWQLLTAMSSASCNDCRRCRGQGSRVATAQEFARSHAARRFQSGDDGVGSDRVHAARAAVFASVPVTFFLRDTRYGTDAAASCAGRTRKCFTLSHAGADSVLLVQRSADASLMAGMWELPELAPERSMATLRCCGFGIRSPIRIIGCRCSRCRRMSAKRLQTRLGGLRRSSASGWR